MVNNVVLKPGIGIGEIAAENDDFFLEHCFIKLPIYEQLLDIQSSKCILLGRTGSGKTAILNHIEKTRPDESIRIDPKDISFKYVSNSSILEFVTGLGCDLSLLFQYLWKHVLIAKSINHYYKNQTNFENAIERIFDAKNSARKYIEHYSDKFWVEQDEIIKEVTDKFSRGLNEDLATKIGHDKLASLQIRNSSSADISNEEKRQIVERVKYAVDKIQMREMSKAIEALNELMDNKQKHFYILIDDLDLDWASSAIQYKLINALMESVKSLRKLRNIKVITAIRSDVFEKAISSHSGEGFQPEKFDGNCANVKWKPQELFDVVNSRINYLFKRKYTKSNVNFKDVFPIHVRKEDTFTYMVERTLYRPRDIIAFVNMSLERASGNNVVTARMLGDVESEYSRKRMDALKHEWKSVHSTIADYLNILERLTGRISIGEIINIDKVDSAIFALSDIEGKGVFKDDCFKIAIKYMKKDTQETRFEFVTHLLSTLYKIGAISIKLAKHSTYINSYINDAIIQPSQVTNDASFSVSPMLWRALGITPNI